MYCKECGALIENPNAVICVKCGTKKKQGKNFCQNCGEVLKNQNAEVCLACGCRVKGSFDGSKNILVAGLLALFFGSLGIHRFYLGYKGIGILQLILCIAGFLTCGITTIIAEIWALIDCILIFTGKIPDAEGNILD